MSAAPTWPEVVLVALNVFQSLALTYMGTRSRRVRKGDREQPGEHEKPSST